METVRTSYAGFWLRLCAALVDAVVLFIPAFVAGVTIGFTDPPNADALLTLVQLLNGVIAWLYFAILESSTWQATIGKRLFNLRVTDVHGRQLSFARATGRHFGKFISTVILGMGYVMVAFTDRKQALHDIMANCLVLRTQSVPPPPPEIQVPPPPPAPDLEVP